MTMKKTQPWKMSENIVKKTLPEHLARDGRVWFTVKSLLVSVKRDENKEHTYDWKALQFSGSLGQTFKVITKKIFCFIVWYGDVFPL